MNRLTTFRLFLRALTSAPGLFSVLLLCSLATAQVDTGTVLGTVRDSSGAVIPGAQVTLTSQTMGVSHQTTTNGEGIYQFPGVRIGTYTITAQAPGFATARQEGVPLSIQQRFVANFELRPSGVEETVEVTAEQAQLQTEEASLGGVVQAQTINDLPLNGRNYTFLAQLNAGVIQAQQDTRGIAGNGNFSANGQPSFANNYLLDGVDNNSNLVDFINGASYTYRPSVDALQEFKVQTSSYSAELGRAAGAVINASIKSGTEQYHGNLFEFHRNRAMDATNFFDNYQGLKKGQFIRNQFGGTFGGPISILNRGERKTFFFMDYEGTVQRQGVTAVLNAPTQLMQQSNFTNFSELLTQGGSRTDRLGRAFPLGTIMDPATSRLLSAGSVDPVTGRTVTGTGIAWVRDPIDPTGNNIIPANRINQNALALLREFPGPTRGGLNQNYAVNPTTQENNHQGDLRIDQYLSQSDTLFGRFSIARSARLVPAPYGGIIDGSQNGDNDQTVKIFSGAASWSHVFSPTIVTEVRFGYNSLDHARIPFNADDYSIPQRFGLSTPQGPFMGGLPTFEVGGLGQFGVPRWIPSLETQSAYQLSAVTSKLAGSHGIKWGFQFSRPNTTFFQPQAPRGYYFYSGTFTEVPNTSGGNTGMAQMLIDPTANSLALPECGASVPAPCKGSFVGGPNQINVFNIPDPTPQTTWQVYSGFAEDSWKATNRLTLTLGLRYDFQRNASAPDGAGANFLIDTDGSNPRYVIGKDRCNVTLSPTFLAQAAADGVAIECAASNRLVNSPRNLFAPRLGLAYSFADRWVVRAGFGQFFLTSGTSGRNGGNVLVGTQLVYPFAYGVSIANFTPGEPIIYGDGTRGRFESGIEPIGANDPSSFNAFNLSLGGIPSPWRIPYTMQYNLTIQHQLSASQTFSIGYVGSQSRHQDLGYNSYNYNAVRVMAPPGLNSRSFRQFPNFNGMNQAINGGNASYNSLQLTYDKRFTHGLAARANYTWSKCLATGRQGLVNNVGNFRSLWLLGPDKGLCDTDAPHMISGNLGYDLPFGQGRAFGANTRGVLNQLIGGWRINSIFMYQSGPPFSIGCNVATTTGQGCNALLTGQPLYPENRSFEHWLNPAAFTNPPVATTIGQTDLSPLGGGPTQVRAPDFRRMDFSVFKNFPISDQQRLEFRAEMFNLTNTPNFSAPGFSGGGAGLPPPPGVLDFSNLNNFGRITNLRLGPNDQRQIQLALKFYW